MSSHGDRVLDLLIVFPVSNRLSWCFIAVNFPWQQSCTDRKVVTHTLNALDVPVQCVFRWVRPDCVSDRNMTSRPLMGWCMWWSGGHRRGTSPPSSPTTMWDWTVSIHTLVGCVCVCVFLGLDRCSQEGVCTLRSGINLRPHQEMCARNTINQLHWWHIFFNDEP